MMKIMTLAVLSALAFTAVSQPASARNNGGAVAAGVIGGLALGAIIGSQAQRNYYSGPAYYGGPGYAYDPGYRAYGSCYMTKQRYRNRHGRIHTRRVRVCN